MPMPATSDGIHDDDDASTDLGPEGVGVAVETGLDGARAVVLVVQVVEAVVAVTVVAELAVSETLAVPVNAK